LLSHFLAFAILTLAIGVVMAAESSSLMAPGRGTPLLSAGALTAVLRAVALAVVTTPTEPKDHVAKLAKSLA
jgi:hypothetical protein